MTSRRINRLLKNKTMKNYKKNQYTGNENGWHEPITTLGINAMDETHANTLNAQFRNTGIKYEETEEQPYDFKPVTTDEADHGEPRMAVQNGEFIETDDKEKVKAQELENENGKIEDGKDDETKQQPAEAGEDGSFVKSDGEIKQAETEADDDTIEGAPNNPA